MSNAFARAKAMFALVVAAMALPLGERQAALARVGAYKSRGKGEGRACNRRARGAVMADKRAALKRRNQQRHRAACKRSRRHG